jgi:hypothetical protein
MRSEDGAPLAGVQVTVRQLGMVTAADGRFRLCGVTGGDTLRAASTGYLDAVVSMDSSRDGDDLDIRLVRSLPGEPIHIIIREGAVPAWRATYVVDGIQAFSAPTGCEEAPPGALLLESLKPEDIATVEVLKDGAGGIVRITTRRASTIP